MTASILQQLLSLYFAITYSWQLSSRKKKSSIYFKDFTDLDFFYTDIFFDFFLIRKACAVLYAANHFVGSETPKHDAFNQFWTFRAFSKKHTSFDGPTYYLCLFKNHQQKFPWPEELPPSHLKVTNMRFGPNIKYFSEPFFADFCCR